MKPDRPIHKINPGTRKGWRIVAQTWCLVDPYRKGVMVEGWRGTPKATCKTCLRLEREAGLAASKTDK